MRHFPIFLDLRGRRVVVSGAGDCAAAKLRLLLKTEAQICVYGANPSDSVRQWAAEGRLILTERPVEPDDAAGAALFYAANDHAAEDSRAAAIGRAAGALTNVVDNLEASQFITPAIVDRDPVTVAIGTEGAAPVLARRIKAETESRLPSDLGALARVGQAFRPQAEALPHGRARRAFWAQYYDAVGPEALKRGGVLAVAAALEVLFEQHMAASARKTPGRVHIIGAGPGDPELLTLKARRLLHEADVVIYDRLVTPEILELARREATFLEVGKTPDGPSWKQDDINALMIKHARKGAVVARVKSGDPGVFGRLDEEMDALDAAEIAFDVVPGLTAATAAAAEMKVSLTQRGRNQAFSILTGRDIHGFSEHDWRGLSRPGATAAVYMGVRAARFIQGRLRMHGAAASTPMTVIENASRPNQKIVATTLAGLVDDLDANGVRGPAIVFLGLTPRAAAARLDDALSFQQEAL